MSLLYQLSQELNSRPRSYSSRSRRHVRVTFTNSSCMVTVMVMVTVTRRRHTSFPDVITMYRYVTPVRIRNIKITQVSRKITEDGRKCGCIIPSMDAGWLAGWARMPKKRWNRVRPDIDRDYKTEESDAIKTAKPTFNCCIPVNRKTFLTGAARHTNSI